MELEASLRVFTRLRLERGWDRQRMADESGLCLWTIKVLEYSYITHWTRASTALLLAEALGREVTDLFRITDEGKLEPRDEEDQDDVATTPGT